MVLLLARAGDADGIEVPSATLETVSPVLKGILTSFAVEPIDSSARAARKRKAENVDPPQPASTAAADVTPLTFDCTSQELEDFVFCASICSPTADARWDPKEVDTYLKRGAGAMRLLDKYDASGVVRMLDMMVTLVLADPKHAVYAPTILSFFEARVALLPDDAPADALSENVMVFLTNHALAKIRGPAQPPYGVPTVPRSGQTLATVRAKIMTELSNKYPRRIMVEMLARMLLVGG